MAWIYLAIAVGCEIIWASSLEATQGYSQLLPSVFNASVLAVNLYFISIAVQSLPVAIAYPVWTGLGSVGVAIVALLFFHESLGLWQILCILAIVLGVTGLEFGKPKKVTEKETVTNITESSQKFLNWEKIVELTKFRESVKEELF